MHDSGLGTGACSDVRVSLILETCLSLKGGPLMWSSRLLTDATATSVFHNRWTFKVLSFPMMDWRPSASKAIVLLTYSCEALNPCRSGFLNRASHAPLLGKISNVPGIWILPTMTIPVHVPSQCTRCHLPF